MISESPFRLVATWKIPCLDRYKMGVINSKEVFKLPTSNSIEHTLRSNSVRLRKFLTIDSTLSDERRRIFSERSMRKHSMFTYDQERLRAISHSDGLLSVRKKSAYNGGSAWNLLNKDKNEESPFLRRKNKNESPSCVRKQRKQANTPFLPKNQSEVNRFLSDTRRKAHEERTKNNQGKNYLLRHAVRRNDIERVKRILLNEDINVNDANDRGITALHEAAIDGNCTCVQLLVEHGADLNQTDNEGFNALDYAVCGGDFECASYLINNGASEHKIRNGFSKE